MQLNRQQLVLLVFLTLVWGLNWPVMKLGVADFAPLAFRALSIWLGLPLLALALLVLRIPFYVPRPHYRALLGLAVTNMLVWHVLIILALKDLSSAR
jgi:drug/metabolite transporter (DMT)-like permease